MRIRVYRSNPEIHYDVFEIPFSPGEGRTIMQALRYISEKLDPTLAFVCHAACSHGICGRCLVRMNGKPVLACVAHAEEEEILLEPKDPRRAKDLLCL